VTTQLQLINIIIIIIIIQQIFFNTGFKFYVITYDFEINVHYMQSVQNFM